MITDNSAKFNRLVSVYHTSIISMITLLRYSFFLNCHDVCCLILRMRCLSQRVTSSLRLRDSVSSISSSSRRGVTGDVTLSGQDELHPTDRRMPQPDGRSATENPMANDLKPLSSARPLLAPPPPMQRDT